MRQRQIMNSEGIQLPYTFLGDCDGFVWDDGDALAVRSDNM